MNKKVVLKIYGYVQGVSFRYNAQRKAKELGILGFVKNEPDGTVKIIAEGKEGQLKEFINWCKIGSFLARVDKVDIKWESPTNEFSDFRIEY